MKISNAMRVRVLTFSLTIAAMLGINVPNTFGQKAATAPSAEPDVLIFNDGEKLIGHLKHSTGASVVFESAMAGEITVDWNKIKELHTNQPFAVIGKDVKLQHGMNGSSVPQGNINVRDQKIEVIPPGQGQAKALPVPSTAYVIDQATFRKNLLENPGFFQGWAGGITAGASLVQATQNSRSFTGAVALTRTVPGENWLDPRNRTLVNFSASYGQVTQRNTPTIKTNIIHGDVERDEYLTSKLFAFGLASWDHNYSQGLDLQQLYGGGLGYTIFKTDIHQLNVKTGINYIRRAYFVPVDQLPPGEPVPPVTPTQNLIASSFGEDYTRKFNHGIVLTQSLTFLPAWNDLDAYSALGSLNLALPLYKRFNLTLGVIDSYLNKPAPPARGNSFQFIAGLTYTLP